MEKVYQITMYENDGGDGYECTTLGIFTNEDVAKGIIIKLGKDVENKLNDLYAEQEELDKKNDDKKWRDKTAVFHPFTADYDQITYEIRNLQRISYEIEEIIINQLYN